MIVFLHWYPICSVVLVAIANSVLWYSPLWA